MARFHDPTGPKAMMAVGSFRDGEVGIVASAPALCDLPAAFQLFLGLLRQGLRRSKGLG